MAQEKRLLVNNAAKEIGLAVKKLEQAKTYFSLADMKAEADELTSLITSIQGNLGHVKAVAQKVKGKNLVTQHPLQDGFVDLWRQSFPDYGQFTPRDWKIIKDFFIELSLAFPNANAELVRRMVDNYRRSNAKWCMSKQLSSFCNNFRHFIHSPHLAKPMLSQPAAKPVQSEEDEGVVYRSVPGMPGVLIPVRK
jgi:hypothetical protein